MARGRRLGVPSGGAARPTRAMVREAVFDMVASAGGIDGCRVADLFAGSGAVGIEALSRGAGQVTFVDSDPRAVAAVRANLGVLGPLAGLGLVVQADVFAWLGRQAGGSAGGEESGGFELVFCDPPYAFGGWGDLFDRIERVVVPGALVVAESSRPIEAPAHWGSVRARGYGSSVLSIVRTPNPASTLPEGPR